jgi:hypothetical protein
MPGHRKADRGRFYAFSEGCATITIDAAHICQFIDA